MEQLPTWYQVSESARIISPDVQRTFAQQMNATTLSSTLVMHLVSHREEIAEFILNATKGK